VPGRQTLDTTGLNCPLPVLKARRALRGLDAGDELEVLATDPGAVKDFQTFAQATGHALLEWREADGVFSFLLRKAGTQ
jgi:tRNA 2-thiouridine synthesizing protein A